MNDINTALKDILLEIRQLRKDMEVMHYHLENISKTVVDKTLE